MPEIPSKDLVAARIRLLLAETAGGNQSELARMTGMSSPDVSRYAAGLHIPRAEHLVALATACDVSVDWILCLTNVRNRLPEDLAGWVDDAAMARLDQLSPGEAVVPYGTLGGRIRLVSTAELARVRAIVDERERQLHGRRGRKNRPRPGS